MKPEDQQIAIANALGYTIEVKEVDYHGEKIKFGYWRDKNGEIIGKGNPPDYLNDLNAIHEAELSLNSRQHKLFRGNLRHVVGKPEFINCKEMISATASQRAEAFLKTLSLWKES